MGKDLRLLAPAIAWAMAVPYFAEAAGLGLDVERKTEIVDHVVPGFVAAVGALVLARGTELAGATLLFLAGLFITAAHVPLVPDMLDSSAPVAASVVHLSAGPPLALVGLWLVLRSLP